MNIRIRSTDFPPQLTALAAAMLAGLCVVASLDGGPLPPVELVAVVEAPGVANRR